MSRGLQVSIGQFSDKGRKEINQDFHGALIPAEPLLSTKGIAIVLADGISSSAVSQVASESAVKSLLTDYYCTPDSWSVKTSAQRVLAATNSWLHAQTRRSQHRYDKDKGYVCTLSALILRSATAYIFHIGDARVFRMSGDTLEQLTNDHRVQISSQQSYLGRAMGVNPQVEIDYQALTAECGDVFVLATDGIYEHVSPRFVAGAIKQYADDLDRAAQAVADEALRRESPDNLTVQIVRIDGLPEPDASEAFESGATLPAPPLLDEASVFEGFRIIREIHGSSRSHIYLAADVETGASAAIKIPSIDLRGDPSYLKRFMMEQWVAQRIDSPHVLKSLKPRKPNHLYVVTEFVEGQTLTQWMIDHPQPDLETMRGIVEQIAKGLRAFHRMEMLHQDLRPDNILIDRLGTVKIIDFGSVKIPGVSDMPLLADGADILGTVQYTAPEYFLGESPSANADLFSLGVIAYQMMTGKLPYGAQIARASVARIRKARYIPAPQTRRDCPAWIDGALRRAVHLDPRKRYDALSEFMFDLRNPNPAYAKDSAAPLMERNPLLFWKALSAALACAVAFLLFKMMQR